MLVTFLGWFLPMHLIFEAAAKKMIFLFLLFIFVMFVIKYFIFLKWTIKICSKKGLKKAENRVRPKIGFFPYFFILIWFLNLLKIWEKFSGKSFSFYPLLKKYVLFCFLYFLYFYICYFLFYFYTFFWIYFGKVCYKLYQKFWSKSGAYKG